MVVTYNDTVSANMYIRSYLCCVYDGILPDVDMVSYMKREERHSEIQTFQHHQASD